MKSFDDDHVAALSKLLFHVFIYVNDVDKDMTPYDVQRFNRLLESPNWTSSAGLRLGLAQLRRTYTSMWEAYDNNTLPISLRSISEQVERVLAPMRLEEIDGLRFALREFIQKVGRPASSTLTRLWVGNAAGSKSKAREEIEGLLVPALPPRVASAHAAAHASPAVADALRPRAVAQHPDLGIWPAALIPVAAPSLWPDGRTLVRCVNVAIETADVKTYSFVAIPSRMFHYKPGQFLTLELSIDGKTVRRSYTISSSPSRPYTISVTVKRVADGVVSNWLWEHMKEGVEIHVNGPHGQFTCFDHPAPKLLLVAGGSGVTPIMSMLRWLADTHSAADVVFINNVRTPADVIFERELHHISSKLGSALRMVVVPGMLVPGFAWNGVTGPMTDQLLNMIAPDLLQREIFVCGPPGYMTMVRAMMERLGLPMQHFHEESFGGPPVGAKAVLALPTATARPSGPAMPTALAPAPSLPAAQLQKALQQVELVFEKSRRTIRCTTNDLILDVAESNGIEMQSACRAGLCGTCKVRKLSGVVDMEGQQALNNDDVSDGYVLACISRICSRVVIDA